MYVLHFISYQNKKINQYYYKKDISMINYSIFISIELHLNNNTREPSVDIIIIN